MQYTLKTTDFHLTDAEKNAAKELGISERFLALMLARGLNISEFNDYLHPSLEAMSSPFEINGIREASLRLRQAIDNKEKVLIYGDYDCDGICAISILALYLKNKTSVDYFIPDRNKHGYGMSIVALQEAVKNCKPKLVVTVDCGITSVNEVEYLKQCGIDVIITDHHEPQTDIPDCIVVDPKLARNGFYDYCGAGVVLKLVEAMSNRDEAAKYLDIAAIATIADVVPLCNDNRIITHFGLRDIMRAPRKGIKMLLGEERVSSHDVMFKLAPRMNAAGRLGSAMKVIGLFLEDDYFMLRTLTEELARDNIRRQEICESVVTQAKEMLHGVDFNTTRIIALYDESWEAGVLGIAAARLAEEFKCPAVLFAKTGDELKGSARSIKCVNIFDLFSSLRQYFTTFGGHAQAAGVSMGVDDFEGFKREANKKLLKEHSYKDFMPEIECEMELPLDMDFLSFAKELELIEPTGYGNPRPNFLIRGCGLRFDKIGFSKHVKCTTKNLDLIGFSKFDNCIAAANGKVEIEVTLGINCYQNNLTAQGVIQSLQAKTLDISEQDAQLLMLHHLSYEGHASLVQSSIEVVEGHLDKPFGTLIVCFGQSEYENLCTRSAKIATLPVLVATTRCLNPENCVVILPSETFDFSFYNDVIIAGHPLSEGYLAYIENRCERCFVLGDCTPLGLNVTDDELRAVYAQLVSLARKSGRLNSAARIYAAVREGYRVDEVKYNTALKIFEELGLVSFSDRGIINISNQRVSLEDSVVYRNLRRYDAK